MRTPVIRVPFAVASGVPSPASDSATRRCRGPRCCAAALAVGVLAGASSPALCQYAARRTTPSTASTRTEPDAPPASGGLQAFRRLFTAETGWFAQLGGLGEGNGIATGAGHRLETRDGELTVRAIASIRESHLTSATYRHALDAGRRWTLVASMTDRRDAQQQFAGTGPESTGELTGYALSTTSGGAALEWQMTPALVAHAGIGSERARVANSTDARLAAISQRYTAGDAAALHRQPTFGVFQAGLRMDTRASRSLWGGGLYTLDWRRYDDRDTGHFSFTSLVLDARHRLALGSDRRHLVLHGLLHHTSAGDAGAVPFYHQPTLGGGRSLRGYDRQRFRDRTALLLQAEYRHQLHRVVAATAFIDAGQVAPDWARVDTSLVRTDYGVGLRLGPRDGPALRTDVAFGGDRAARVVFGFGTSF